MIEFRSVTNELGRLGKNGDRQCTLCGMNVRGHIYMLWTCPVYDSIRNTFTGELDKLLGWGVLRSLVHLIILIGQAWA